MRRRITIVLLALACIVLLLPAAAVWYATRTEAGLHMVIRLLNGKVGPVTMWITGEQGTFAGGFRVEHFRLLHERVEVRAEGISGHLNVLPLLWATIKSNDGHIEKAYVHVLPHTASGKPLTKFMPPLLAIVTENARIDAATLLLPNGHSFDGTDLKASGALRAHDMRFHDVSFRMGDLRCEAAGLLTAQEPMALSGESRWAWNTAGQPPWLLTADFDGDLATLNIHSLFTRPFSAELQGAALDLTGAWHWQGKARIDDLDIRAWGGGGALGRITGNLDVHGDRDGFAARGPLLAPGIDAGPIDTVFEGNWAGHVLTAKRIDLVHRSSRSTVNASGTIGIVTGGPELGLRGSWRSFQWPLHGNAPAVTSPGGEFTLAGRWPFDLQASGRVRPAGLPEFPAQLRASLAKDRLAVHDGTAQLWGGKANIAGDARWAPQYGWDFKGHVVDLDVAQLRADVPGRIGFDFQAGGNRFSGDTDLDLQVSKLAGRLRGAAARGAGHLQRAAGLWSFDDVSLSAGGLNLALDGSWGTAADIDFRLDATDLSIIAPQSRGRLNARGSFKGTLDNPLLRLTASAANIQHEGITLRSAEADVDVDTRPGKTLHASVKLRDLGARDRQLNSLDFSLTGKSDANRVAFAAQAVGTRVSATADGGFASGSWHGRWQRFTVDDNANLHLKLESQAALQVGAALGNLERFCLKGSTAKLCSSANWTAQQWSATTEASDLPMSALTAGLTPKVAYEGRLDVRARAFANGGGPIEGSLHAELTDAQLRRTRSKTRVDLIRLGSGTVNVTADRDALRASFAFDAHELGNVGGELTAQRAGYALTDMPLRGSIKASTRELDFINIYVPDIDRAAGNLLADIAIGGTSGRPAIGGLLQLADGEFDFYQVNLRLRKVAMQARINDNRVEFTGAAQTEDGKLDAHGELAWRSGSPQGTLQLTGKDLLLVNVPEARIVASPDLKFAINGHLIDVTGTVTVPSARIQPADLTGAVLSSSDEVIKGSAPVDPADRFQIASNIRMVLGDHVNIDTFGLSGRLTGDITAQTTADGISRGTGELNIADGKYAAFGRRLDVQRGRLIFGGGLLDDPGMELRATKQFPDVVAGVNVRGTLRQPRMTFFSEPALPQSQIVSLILAGGSLETAQNSDKSGVARGELLAQGGAILAQQLGQRVGVDDVSIEQSLTNETSLVLGKFLSPRLYVSYGISLAESINTIKMRYTLGDRWTIKTEAGKERSADLVYTIEK